MTYGMPFADRGLLFSAGQSAFGRVRGAKKGVEVGRICERATVLRSSFREWARTLASVIKKWVRAWLLLSFGGE